MLKFCALILSIIALQSYDCRIVKRDSTRTSSSHSYSGEPVIKRYVVSSPSSPIERSSSDIGESTVFGSQEGGATRVIRQSSSSTYSSAQPSTSYSSSPASSSSFSSSSQPVYSSYIPSSSSSSQSAPAPSVATSSSSGGANPLDGLASLFSLGNSKGSGSGSGLGGFVESASGGVKTILEIKRDIIIPLIMGILNFVKNIATSETLHTIANVKLGAARTALSVGPSFIRALAGIASTAGEVTSTLINIFLCNIICPLQGDPNACSAQASCSGIGVSPTKTTYSSSSLPSQASYIIS